MKPKHPPSHARLTEVICYNPQTGQFRWRVRRSGIAFDQQPGNIQSNGYRRISIENASYLAHRLAWFYITGEWPAEDIDHINRNKDDNRFANLRVATRSQNLANGRVRRNGMKGVFYNQHNNRWYARLSLGGKIIHLGCRKTEWEAHLLYLDAAHQHHGQFARAK